MAVKNTLTALFFILACFTVHAQHVSDTLYAKDYGFSPLFILNGCKNVSVKKNAVQCEAEAYFKVENMKKNDLHSDLRR